MYIFLNDHDVLRRRLMYEILNHVLYFVLYPLLYTTPLFFVHILIIVILHVYREGPLKISTMY